MLSDQAAVGANEQSVALNSMVSNPTSIQMVEIQTG